MSDIRSSREQLSVSWKALCTKWNNTQLVWNDPVSQRFDKEYWTVVEQQSQMTLAEMEKLAQTINEARQRIHPVGFSR